MVVVANWLGLNTGATLIPAEDILDGVVVVDEEEDEEEAAVRVSSEAGYTS